MDLSSIPPEFRNRISHNGTMAELGSLGWTELPNWIGDLTSIQVLNLTDNQLTRLPDTIGNLTSLTQLYLAGNQLTYLPSAIANLTSLNYLNLHNNRLKELPRELIGLLRGGLDIRLSGNPLAHPLPELAERGQAEIAAYLQSLEDSVAQYEGKVLLVGEGNVGKSSLVAALKREPFIEGRPTTHGIEISAVPFRHPSLDLDMTLRLWDFGGQEVYRVSHQFFFSRRAVYLVVWHARQGQEQNEVEGWLRRVRLQVGGEAIALVVATHTAERRPDLDYPQLKQLFPGMLAGQLEIDSCTGGGIESLRQAICKSASQLPQMGQLISRRWMDAREAVLAHGTEIPQISYNEFGLICAKYGVIGEQASTLAKLMHDLGLIVYYNDDEGLKDVVVLNPEWLTKAISYVLEDRETATENGILDHRRLAEIWQERANGYPAKYHPYFLRLMEKFDVSYRLQDEQASLVAQLVPRRRPNLPWNFGTVPRAGFHTLALTFELSEVAPGLVSWLTVRHHRDSTGMHWRNGVFLQHAIGVYQSQALLELQSPTRLILEVRAPSPDMYLNELRSSIERLIRERWRGLHYRLWVPCSGPGPRCPGLFPLDALLRFRENGVGKTGCYECGEQREISVLLTGFAVPGESLADQLSQVNTNLTELSKSVGGLTAQTTEIALHTARTADMMRLVLGSVATEVRDCPRLFTWRRRLPDLSQRIRLHQEHYELTLWCEHPGAEHPCEAATYDIDPPKKWFAEIAPYARLVVKMLQLAVPVAAALDIAALPAAKRDSAQVRLEIVKSLVEDLPVVSVDSENRQLAESSRAAGGLTRAEGQALRAVRRIIFEKDPDHAFGDMRRVQSPARDLLWVCVDHYREYDPGLPILPRS